MGIERRVLAQDRRLETPELLARVEPELVQQTLACGPVRLERVGLAPRAVEREHELAVQVLAQRVLHDQALQLAHQLGLPATRQLSVDPRLEGCPPQLVEA